MRQAKEEDGEGIEDCGDGEQTRLVRVAAEMTDHDHGQHEPDVIHVLDETSHGTGHAEPVSQRCTQRYITWFFKNICQLAL